MKKRNHLKAHSSWSKRNGLPVNLAQTCKTRSWSFAGLSHLCSQLASGGRTSNGAGIWTANPRSRLDKSLDPLEAVVERQMWCKPLAILDNANHPLHRTQCSSFSERPITLCLRTERHRRSFVLTAIRLCNNL